MAIVTLFKGGIHMEFLPAVVTTALLEAQHRTFNAPGFTAQGMQIE